MEWIKFSDQSIIETMGDSPCQKNVLFYKEGLSRIYQGIISIHGQDPRITFNVSGSKVYPTHFLVIPELPKKGNKNLENTVNFPKVTWFDLYEFLSSMDDEGIPDQPILVGIVDSACNHNDQESFHKNAKYYPCSYYGIRVDPNKANENRIIYIGVVKNG